LNKLPAAQVKSCAPGMYADGGGLVLHKREDGGAQWFLRVTVRGRRREMGLGALRDVSLNEARETAAEWRSVARQGKDPIKERQRQRREAEKADHTLAAVAVEAFEARKAQLKGDGKAGRWFSPLELHVLPKLGRVPIEELDQRDVKNALAPIWHSKADTAKKALNRLGIVVRHAAAMGLDVDVQVTEKAKALLGKSRHQPRHVPAMHWREVPAFYQSLNEGTITHLALRLLILTATRSSEVRFCHVDEIDGDVWTIPGARMKAGKEHRIPLSEEAQGVIQAARAFERDGFLFPNVRKGVISDATISRFMGRQGLEARPHGFRSSFRT
jgi:integrase